MHDLTSAYKQSVQKHAATRAARTTTYRQILGSDAPKNKVTRATAAAPAPLPRTKQFSEAELDDMFSYG